MTDPTPEQHTAACRAYIAYVKKHGGAWDSQEAMRQALRAALSVAAAGQDSNLRQTR